MKILTYQVEERERLGFLSADGQWIYAIEALGMEYHDMNELIRGMTLKAGTIISTGTPAGAGVGFNPPKYLKPGDVMECFIDGIGTLTNRIG